MSNALRQELGIDEILAKLDALSSELRTLKASKGPELLTIDQAADMIKKSPRTVSRWRAEGRFTPHSSGKTPLIAISEITPLIPADVTPSARQSRQRSHRNKS